MRRALVLLLAPLLTACGLWVPRIGFYQPVVTGGQGEIDQGRVVDVNGLPGIWLAGHHTTHGAIFARLGEVQVGDLVCVYGTCYHVTRIMVVPQSYLVGAALGKVVLQTSWPGGRLRLVICD